MVKPEILRKRLNKLDEYLEILEGMQKYSFHEFSSDPERYGSAERFLQLSIEAITDMASHIVSDEEIGHIDEYRDAPRLFHDQGWIDDALVEKWKRIIGFRNVLVHDYLYIKLEIVYATLQNRLDDLRELRSVLSRFL